MRLLRVAALTSIFCSVFFIANAQSPLGIGTAEPAISSSGILSPLFTWINTHQQQFYRAMTAALREMRNDPWAITSLISLSFLYGAFHAAGPGHGKAVISSYMLANETQLKRGVVISFISALMQGAVAILMVGTAFFALRGTSISMTDATRLMEITSFALVAAFGAWLLFSKLRAIFFPTKTAKSKTLTTAESTNNTGMGTGLRFKGQAVFEPHESTGLGNVCTSCGNSHAPDPSRLNGKTLSLKDAWSAIVAVGMRPCSGAIIVLSFALLNGVYLGGILSVLAMSIGTAITVAILASMASGAKGMVIRYAKPGSNKATTIAQTIEIMGALFILVIGLLLLGAALRL